MCCFTGPVASVSATKIFARLQEGRQWIAYSMRLAADQDVAMVLPLPVVAGTLESAVTFVDLSTYPDLFEDLASLSPRPMMFGSDRAAPVPLEVRKVGAFEASFVPTMADFARLDPRFRLPDSFFRSRTTYRDWGFAVFKLRADRDERVLHPMAFSFPTRRPSHVFFPTVHAHDGTVPPEAQFDHTLYAQVESLRPDLVDHSGAPGAWSAPVLPPAPRPERDAEDTPLPEILQAARTGGVVAADQPIRRRDVVGPWRNEDLWFELEYPT